jgi:2,5-furandicarboxylate decarboxylase 1
LPPDLDQFRLRRFLETLPAHEIERHDAPIDLADVAKVIEGNPKAVWLSAVGPERASLVGNVPGSRSRLAHAFATTPERLLGEVTRRLRNPAQFVEITRAQAPAQQAVLTGTDADLTKLPVHLQHHLDGAPYISASMDIVIDPASGHHNVGIRRLMLRGRQECGVDLVAPSDLRAIYERESKAGRKVPVAFVVGSHPIDHVAATMRIPGDELALLASLRGAPLPLVKCITNDLRVPADAEYVLEGYFDERGHVEAEGPYGEFLGYYGAVKQNPVFHLTAITHRIDAVFQTASIGGLTLAYTDTAQLNGLRTEVTLARALESAVREVTGIYAVPASGGAFNIRIAMRQRVPGEARNAIAAAFGCIVNVKHVFVVDPDIDIFNDAQMDWALATRFQADRDLVIQTGMRTLPLDPSLAGARVGTKAGFDLTQPWLPPGGTRPIEHRIPSPPAYDGKRFDSVRAALADGPKYFVELMSAVASRDGREVVLAIDAARTEGRLKRDNEGRYSLG